MDFCKLRSVCTEENKLVPSIVRHVHRVEDKVIRIIMSPSEPNIFGKVNLNQRVRRLCEENYIRASDLVNTHVLDTAIKVPRLIAREDEDVTVWEYIDGCPLDQLWNKLTVRQREGLKLQLREFIIRLWKIPSPTEFAVGTLCSTHELLCDNFHPHHPEYAHMFWTKNGPYTTVEDYKSTAANLFYSYEPTFPVREPVDSALTSRYVYSISEGLATVRPAFDHLDWSKSNIIVHPNGDYVAGVVDWEYAAFIPDPEDYFLQNVPAECRKNEDWWSLFDGAAVMYWNS